MKAVIHYRRVNKPEVTYTETLVSDDGSRVDTFAKLSKDFSREWSVNVWQRVGALQANEFIATVRKYLFYHEWFSIMELRDEEGGLLGFYCDMVTPLEKRDGEYYQLDLLLDLWIRPGRSAEELDWDEFEQAAHDGLITVEQQRRAADTLAWLSEETAAGRFPWSYLPPESRALNRPALEEDAEQ